MTTRQSIQNVAILATRSADFSHHTTQQSQHVANTSYDLKRQRD